jgi:hypothetical protein
MFDFLSIIVAAWLWCFLLFSSFTPFLMWWTIGSNRKHDGSSGKVWQPKGNIVGPVLWTEQLRC